MPNEIITCILSCILGIWGGRLIGLIERDGIKLENKELKRQIDLYDDKMMNGGFKP